MVHVLMIYLYLPENSDSVSMTIFKTKNKVGFQLVYRVTWVYKPTYSTKLEISILSRPMSGPGRENPIDLSHP